MSKQLTLTSPEAQRKAALEAIPKCQEAMGAVANMKIVYPESFKAYRDASILLKASIQVLKGKKK